MKFKLIERIAVIAFAIIIATSAVLVPTISYGKYQDYLEQIKQEQGDKPDDGGGTKPSPKPTLKSISAKLADGVSYYANNLAEVKNEHFVVTATYSQEGKDDWTENVEPAQFDVSAPADFYQKGGDVTITYRGKTAVVSVSLVPVVLSAIEVAVLPYTVCYAVGSNFSNEGMVVNAIYNDGSKQALQSNDYNVDKTTLQQSDKSVTVSYTENGVTKTTTVAITVQQTVQNGNPTAIEIVGDAIVNVGQTVSDAMLQVNAVYANGNKKLLNADEYTIKTDSEVVAFGKQYTVEVALTDNNAIKTSASVVVRAHVEGENGTVVGGNTKTEDEYVVDKNGSLVKTGNGVTFAGGFSKTASSGQEASVSFSFNSLTQSSGTITMRCGNSYLKYANGSNADGGYIMQPLQISTVLDVTINGKEVAIPATVVLKGCGPWESYAPLYGIYYEFTFDAQFDAGVNVVKFQFKPSTEGALNCWGESPSTMNIDYVNFDSKGREIASDAKVTALELADNFSLVYGTNLSDVVLPVVGVLQDGTKVGIDASTYKVELVGGTGKDYVEFGKYTATVTLLSDPTIKVTAKTEVERTYHFVVLTAGVQIENGRVMYVFTGESIGYEAKDIVFFDDGGNIPATITFGKTTFEMKIDATDFATGSQCYPHLKIKGENYNNGGANANGDIRDRGLTWQEGQSVTLNGKVYTITEAYSMPTLVVSAQ